MKNKINWDKLDPNKGFEVKNSQCSIKLSVFGLGPKG